MFKLRVDEELSLSLVTPAYAGAMFKLIDKDRAYLSRWLAWPPIAKRAQDYAAFATSVLHRYADGTALPCCIVYHNELVGAAGFTRIEPGLGRAKLGYWLASCHQGKGIVTRVCQKLIDVGFTEMGLEKIELAAAQGNSASRAVAERLGMQFEGVIPDAENLNGRIVSHVVYGLCLADRSGNTAK